MGMVYDNNLLDIVLRAEACTSCWQQPSMCPHRSKAHTGTISMLDLRAKGGVVSVRPALHHSLGCSCGFHVKLHLAAHWQPALVQGAPDIAGPWLSCQAAPGSSLAACSRARGSRHCRSVACMSSCTWQLTGSLLSCKGLQTLQVRVQSCLARSLEVCLELAAPLCTAWQLAHCAAR